MLPENVKNAAVVLVDDTPANLRLLESSMKAFGLRNVRAFSDSAAALDWLQGMAWDLLVLDLDMPAPNGFDILKALEDRDRSASPIIVVSALSRPEDRRKGLSLGANDYICKPLDLPELLLRVRNSLALSIATQSLRTERDQLDQAVLARTAQLRDSYQSIIGMLSRAAGYRENETERHVMRIGEYAALIARGIGLTEEQCENMRLAMPMHDIGKIGIPEEILKKSGPFTPEQREIMQHHARIGYHILNDSKATPLTLLAAEIALFHHEHWDGQGYPQGLKGEDIPLSGRIAAICDVYDALRSARPYKTAWSAEETLAFFRERSGSHFDPELVHVFERIFDQLEGIQSSLVDEAPKSLEELARMAGSPISDILNERDL
ncbi:MAG: HD-GYP domain-containing protein [Arenimonas sp.]